MEPFQSWTSPERRLIRTFPVNAKRSNRLKFTPDGKRVLISDLTNGGLVVVDVATRKEVKRLTLGRSIAGILCCCQTARALTWQRPTITTWPS